MMILADLQPLRLFYFILLSDDLQNERTGASLGRYTIRNWCITTPDSLLDIQQK